jgi:hypothetical protein
VSNLKWWYRTEGAAVFVAALVLYFQSGGEWWLLLVLALAPDLSALGFIAGPRVGSLTYNLVHTYVGPVALATIALVTDWRLGLQIALIWLAHIGIDRALGYTLRRPDQPMGGRKAKSHAGGSATPTPAAGAAIDGQ